MNRIIISSFAHATQYVADHNPEFILSICDPGSESLVKRGTACKEHCILEFHDVVQVFGSGPYDYIVPSTTHAATIMEFGRRWDGQGDLLVHCYAGVSRSSAAGLIILATIAPNQIVDAAKKLRESGPWLWPNDLLIECGDHVLGSNGRLIATAEAMGAARMIGAPRPAILELD